MKNWWDKNPFTIGIAGESGVGKSTIAEIISLYFGIQHTTIISTDDLHKWERSNKNWETFTHLNPDANNLELGDLHIEDLSLGKFIYRSKYSHITGYFDPPIKILPQQVVIVEGLHAFYTDASKKLIDLKIFVDTDEDLRTHWKILRDTEERGYKYNVVLDTIKKRKIDSIKIRNAQISAADVIVRIEPKQKIKYLGDKNERVYLDFTISNCKNPTHEEFFNFIKKYITNRNKFISAAEIIGNNIEMCQNGGGNISTKISNEFMLIKSSGFSLKDIYKTNGYSLINYQNIISSLHDKKIKNDDLFTDVINQSIVSDKYKRPSMEVGFHCFLDNHIIHVHPIYLTLLLCLDNSIDVINTIYNDLDFQYIKYLSPGFHLAKNILSLDRKPIYFLENHGIILSSNDMDELINLLADINERSKKYIMKHCSFEEFNISFADLETMEHHSFPDSVIFYNDHSKKEIAAAHNYINIMGPRLGKIRYLSSNQIHQLKNMESEKYRKSI